jgi:hypothetical protein
MVGGKRKEPKAKKYKVRGKTAIDRRQEAERRGTTVAKALA